MTTWLQTYEGLLRLGIFLTVFIALACAEVWRPARKTTLTKSTRWVHNLGLSVINTLLLRLLFPTAAVGMAWWVGMQGWGLWAWIPAPEWIQVVLSVVALDAIIYAQHVASHHVSWLWRLHRVHHADQDMDVTTAARFHPLEIVFSMGIKFLAIAALGTPVLAVLVFEILLSSSAMFNHSNLHLPHRADKALRWFLVTPAMHQVHHSTRMTETNSNYGFCLPWWDHLFATYRFSAQIPLTIGLNEYRNPKISNRLLGMLLMPFGSRS